MFDTKPEKSGFLSFAGPLANVFTLPFATVLDPFALKSNYCSLIKLSRYFQVMAPFAQTLTWPACKMTARC